MIVQVFTEEPTDIPDRIQWTPNLAENPELPADNEQACRDFLEGSEIDVNRFQITLYLFGIRALEPGEWISKEA